jgi:hypothetical protein
VSGEQLVGAAKSREPSAREEETGEEEEVTYEASPLALDLMVAGGDRRLGLWRELGLRCGTADSGGARADGTGGEWDCGVDWGRRKATSVVVAAWGGGQLP